MKPNIEERMEHWLQEQADAAGIPDEDRQRFIDHMRGTTAFAGERLNLAASDLWEAPGVPSWVKRLAMWLARRRMP